MTRKSVGIALRGAGGFVASRPDWILERLATLPTTNVRIFVTLVVFLATALRYLTDRTNWTPSIEWVGLILGMAGIDVAQFVSKRRTSPEYLTAQNGADAPIPNQDVSPETSHE